MAHSRCALVCKKRIALCLALGVLLVLNGEIGIAYDVYDRDGDTYCNCCHDVCANGLLSALCLALGVSFVLNGEID